MADLVPAYNKTTQKYGMLNTVNNAFSTSETATDFMGTRCSNPTYFYPLNQFISNLGTHENEVAYFDYTGTAPDMSAFSG